MKVLVHVCCAPCFTYPYKQLSEQGYEVTGFFYNPNIHPFMEYQTRKESVEKFAKLEQITVIYGSYDLVEETARPNRCKRCYMHRLEATARYAKENGFDAFTSTMLSSHQQYHDALKDIGLTCADTYEIPFHYEDFRKGVQQGNAITKTYGLYRQKYCGCIFSELERFGETSSKTSKKTRHTVLLK